ncbi:hypothetical protein J2858_002824 [Neorhizobium galegae]|nr:hypothetical protein [Neorhizobium galegae]MBP2549891.1 hypothetical protein [Neorhizobium galegae]
MEPDEGKPVLEAQPLRRDVMPREWLEAASLVLAIATCYMLIVPV